MFFSFVQFMNQTRQGMGMKMENPGGNPGMRPGMQPGMGGQVLKILFGHLGVITVVTVVYCQNNLTDVLSTEVQMSSLS